jgi:hypothetical protein
MRQKDCLRAKQAVTLIIYGAVVDQAYTVLIMEKTKSPLVVKMAKKAIKNDGFGIIGIEEKS